MFFPNQVVERMVKVNGLLKKNYFYEKVWLVEGLHDSVKFSMMEAGHTKFNPNWHFGLWKVKWRHSTVETLDEIAAIVSIF